MNYFLNITKAAKSTIYNKISNHAGLSVYPDILYSHPFDETAIVDDSLFEVASNAIKEYGTSNVIFFATNNSSDGAKLNDILEDFYKEPITPDYFDYIDTLCDTLLLTHAMSQKFKQLMLYYIALGNDPHSIKVESISNKKEGIKEYERIKELIIN